MDSLPDRLNRAILSIYAAVSDEEGWRQANRVMADAVGAAHGNTMITRSLPVIGWTFFSDGFSDYDHRDAYFAPGGYLGLSPLRPLVDSRPEGAIVSDDEVGEANYRNTRFFKEFVKPQGLGRVMASHVAMVADGALSMSFYRPPRARPFSARARQLFAALQPHVKRALQLEAMMSGYDMTRRSALEALADAGLGAAFVDGTGRVVVGNRMAEEIFVRNGSGVRLERGRLRPVAPAAEAVFLKAVAGCARDDMAGLELVGQPIVCRTSATELPVVLKVVPVAGMARWIGGWGGSVAALVLLRDPSAMPAADTWRILASLYDLTPAEIRVGRVLAARPDWSTEQVASVLGRSANTAKSNRARLYSKLSVSGQAELVKLVSDFRGI